ncbi:MAG: hypothetical protein HFJ38_06235 [Bacilli bacterium]|nr:hypothetical protein [Bacilli bacterium]
MRIIDKLKKLKDCVEEAREYLKEGNILAEARKELDEVQKNTTEEEYEIKKEEFLKLYNKLREKEEQMWWHQLTKEQRDKLHPLVLTVYKIKNRIDGFDCKVIKDERKRKFISIMQEKNIKKLQISWKTFEKKQKEEKRPVIYVLTHVGKYDIQVVSEAIKKHYTLLSGDYEHIQGTIDAIFLGINGVEYFCEIDKEERKTIQPRMIQDLQNGIDLMYFIEGTWNMTEELPVIPAYWGVVDVAKKGNALITPIACAQYDKRFKTNIGEYFHMEDYGEGTKEKTRGITDLRDELARLNYEIWETEEPLVRSEIPDNYWEDYCQARFAEWPYFNHEYINKLVYKPKGVTKRDEVYEPVKKLEINKKNAFLFYKNNKDRI